MRQRLVHQEHLRLAHDRSTHGHPLALAAGQMGRLAIEEILEVEDPGRSRSVVDLPQPDGPTRTRNSPSPISRSR